MAYQNEKPQTVGPPKGDGTGRSPAPDGRKPAGQQPVVPVVYKNLSEK